MMAGLVGFFTVGLMACRGKATTAVPSEEEIVLVTVKDSVLTKEAVERMIPTGLEPSDSIAMFETILNNWIQHQVLTSVAEENLTDMERIERLTREYRDQLIIEDYLRKMSSSVSATPSAKEMKQYYDAHPEEFVLSQPLVKGAWLQTREDDAQIENLRQWMRAKDESSLDQLEKYGMKHAMRYEYFGETWVPWSEVTERIPYRFGNGDEFLKSNSDFETLNGNEIYLLHVREWLPSGAQEPFESARQKIAGILMERAIAEKRVSLIRSIYQKAMKDGTMVAGDYNPLTSEMKK